jgi:hypothetical protein
MTCRSASAAALKTAVIRCDAQCWDFLKGRTSAEGATIHAKSSHLPIRSFDQHFGMPAGTLSLEYVAQACGMSLASVSVNLRLPVRPQVPYREIRAMTSFGRPILRWIIALLAAGSCGVAPQLQAHHSYAMFDTGKQVTLHGSLREFQWTNPHCFLQILVRRSDVTREWSVQMDNPQSLYRKGWRPGTLKAGDKLTVVIHPTRDGSQSGRFVSGTGPDGKPLLED